MENENNTQQNNFDLRRQKIEDFLLNPDKTIFTSVEELKDALEEVKRIFGETDISKLETLQGEDGKTPVRGVDYFTPEDIQAFEDFILDNFPEADVDFPTIDSVEKYLDEKISEIPRVKGDRGEKGKDGKDGKDGSPDSPRDILSKIRILGNNGLKIKDINGLTAKLTQLNTLSDDLDKLNELVMKIPVSMGGVSIEAGGGGGGTWGSITGTLSDQTDLQNALNAKLSSVNISDINATGTPSSTTYLRGDGTWTTVSSGGGITLTDLSATAPISYDNTTGVFSMAKADASNDGYLDNADWTTFNNKQDSLGFTPEDVANKKTSLSDNSDTYYPTQKAVKTAVDAKQDSLGFTPENSSNKENATIDTSTTKYPTVNLLKTGLDAKIDKSIVNAKGDILTATADDTPARLAVGTDGQVLTADSNEATGLKYTTPLSASSTDTLTNKRISKRISTTTSVASITPDISSYDVYELTAQNADFTLNLPSVDEAGQIIVVRILTSSAKTLTIDAGYKAENTLPSALASGKRYEFIINQFNTGGSKEYWITGIEF